MKKIVKELMIERFVKVNEADQIYDAVAKIAANRETTLVCVVDEQDRLKGIITPKRVLKMVAVREFEAMRHSLFLGPGLSYALTTAKYAKDIMNAPVSVRPEDSVEVAVGLMLDRDIYEVPVVDDKGRVMGAISYIDIISSYHDCLRRG
ncbi:MAG: CBS domain-containing protein [Dehalococcoidia bacterium]|nr:CBS domain-containing protein [Dehalococcoidia bacterium]